jgi:hypothetical protein
MSTAASDRASLALRISFSFKTRLSNCLSPAFNRWSSSRLSDLDLSSPDSRSRHQRFMVPSVMPAALMNAALEPHSRHLSYSSRIACFWSVVKCFRFETRTGITKSMTDLPPLRAPAPATGNLSHNSLTHRESGPIRPMYDPIRSPKCAQCAHALFPTSMPDPTGSRARRGAGVH